MRVACLAVACVLALTAVRPAAQPRTTAERINEAFRHAYNLDHDQAVALLEQAIREDPSNPAPHRALATIVWLNLLFRRGMVLVENYLGPVSRDDVKMEPPPEDVARRFRTALDNALALARERVRKAPNDPSALHELGTAYGLQASWAATVEGRVMGAFGAARRAFNTQERVLELAPARHDAGLIVGIYRYLVGSLILPARWVAYLAGFGGDKERGIALIEQAARYHSEASTEAKFALVLLYNREKQYDRALARLAELQRDSPRNRLLWLEAGSTSLRAGRAAEAEKFLTEGLQKLATDRRPRMFGEEGLWFYKRGAARVQLGRAADARADLEEGLKREAQAWVRGRMHLELGKAADLAGERGRAMTEYARCQQLCAAAGDEVAVNAARRFRASAYRNAS
ncbi:MAG TPA: hypothetical protein VIL35_07065 [Vicinamibacterales bacterium]